MATAQVFTPASVSITFTSDWHAQLNYCDFYKDAFKTGNNENFKHAALALYRRASNNAKREVDHTVPTRTSLESLALTYGLPAQNIRILQISGVPSPFPINYRVAIHDSGYKPRSISDKLILGLLPSSTWDPGFRDNLSAHNTVVVPWNNSQINLYNIGYEGVTVVYTPGLYYDQGVSASTIEVKIDVNGPNGHHIIHQTRKYNDFSVFIHHDDNRSNIDFLKCGNTVKNAAIDAGADQNDIIKYIIGKALGDTLQPIELLYAIDEKDTDIEIGTDENLRLDRHNSCGFTGDKVLTSRYKSFNLAVCLQVGTQNGDKVVMLYPAGDEQQQKVNIIRNYYEDALNTNRIVILGIDKAILTGQISIGSVTFIITSPSLLITIFEAIINQINVINGIINIQLTTQCPKIIEEQEIQDREREIEEARRRAARLTITPLFSDKGGLINVKDIFLLAVDEGNVIASAERTKNPIMTLKGLVNSLSQDSRDPVWDRGTFRDYVYTVGRRTSAPASLRTNGGGNCKRGGGSNEKYNIDIKDDSYILIKLIIYHTYLYFKNIEKYLRKINTITFVYNTLCAYAEQTVKLLNSDICLEIVESLILPLYYILYNRFLIRGCVEYRDIGRHIHNILTSNDGVPLPFEDSSRSDRINFIFLSGEHQDRNAYFIREHEDDVKANQIYKSVNSLEPSGEDDSPNNSLSNYSLTLYEISENFFKSIKSNSNPCDKYFSLVNEHISDFITLDDKAVFNDKYFTQKSAAVIDHLSTNVGVIDARQWLSMGVERFSTKLPIATATASWPLAPQPTDMATAAWNRFCWDSSVECPTMGGGSATDDILNRVQSFNFNPLHRRRRGLSSKTRNKNIHNKKLKNTYKLQKKLNKKLNKKTRKGKKTHRKTYKKK